MQYILRPAEAIKLFADPSRPGGTAADIKKQFGDKKTIRVVIKNGGSLSGAVAMADPLFGLADPWHGNTGAGRSACAAARPAASRSPSDRTNDRPTSISPLFGTGSSEAPARERKPLENAPEDAGSENWGKLAGTAGLTGMSTLAGGMEGDTVRSSAQVRRRSRIDHWATQHSADPRAMGRRARQGQPGAHRAGAHDAETQLVEGYGCAMGAAASAQTQSARAEPRRAAHD